MVAMGGMCSNFSSIPFCCSWPCAGRPLGPGALTEAERLLLAAMCHTVSCCIMSGLSVFRHVTKMLATKYCSLFGPSTGLSLLGLASMALCGLVQTLQLSLLSNQNDEQRW